MIRSTFSLLLLLGTHFSTSVYGLKTQAEADEVCRRSFPDGSRPIAKMNEEKTRWVECVAGPPPKPSILCFGEPYVDPKTHQEGCCDEGVFSFDEVSKEGQCCPSGEKFSWDAASGKGGCCAGTGGAAKFSCGCGFGAPPPEPVLSCPTADGKIITVNGKEYMVYCKRQLPGHNLGESEMAASMTECAHRCSLKTGCKGAEFNKGKCQLKDTLNLAWTMGTEEIMLAPKERKDW